MAENEAEYTGHNSDIISRVNFSEFLRFIDRDGEKILQGANVEYLNGVENGREWIDIEFAV